MSLIPLRFFYSPAGGFKQADIVNLFLLKLRKKGH